MTLPNTLSLRLLWIGLSAALLVCAPGCEQVVDLEGAEHEPKLVLQSRFVPGQPWKVEVSHSRGAFEPGDVLESSYTVTDATVEIYQADTKLGKLELDSLDRYSSPALTPEPQTPYTVRVSAPELGTVEATDQAPALPPARVSLLSIENAENAHYDRILRLTIDDPEETNNYYHLTLHRKEYYGNGEVFEYNYSTFLTRTRAIVNEMGVTTEQQNKYRGSEARFTDALFDGRTYDLDLQVSSRIPPINDEEPLEEQKTHEEYILILRILSEHSYEYRRTERLSGQTIVNPFAEPVNVHSNVEGGYGLVGGRNVDTLRHKIAAEGLR